MPKSKYQNRDLSDSFNIRVQPADTDNLKQVCKRLGLPPSEVLRRAVREGLKAFHGVELPGASTDEATV
jgi:hypothetical protein